MLHAAWMAAGGLAAGAAAHINMVSPMPLQYKGNPYAQHIDYDIKSPLTPGEYPCHGALGEFAGRGGTPVEAWTPGQAHTVRLEGAATHNGGSCQLSLSYDAGQSFVVLYSKVGGCPLGLALPFVLPADAPPADRALLAWSWNNHSGNREFYMNCASIQILAAGSKKDGDGYHSSNSNSSSSSSSGGGGDSHHQKTTKREKGEKKKPESGGKRRRRQKQKQGSSYANAALPRIPMHRQDDGVPFASRPRIMVANLFNTTGSACVAEGHDILYPQPGPDYDDVSTAAALPFDCATGQVIPFGAPAPPVPSSVVPLVPSGTPTASSSSSSSSSSMGDSGSVSTTTTSSIPYESETSSASSTSPAPSATTVATLTSGAAPAPTTSSPGGSGAGVLTGPCADEGVYNCIDGASFQRCASGQWSAAEPVAPGTRCTPGLGNGDAGAARRRRWRRGALLGGRGL